MRIIDDHREDTGWITAVILGRWVQAKVFDLPSTYGINNGRVSKLAVSATSTRIRGVAFFDQMDFNYDRGLDFHKQDMLPPQLLDNIVAELEALPQTEENDRGI